MRMEIEGGMQSAISCEWWFWKEVFRSGIDCISRRLNPDGHRRRYTCDRLQRVPHLSLSLLIISLMCEGAFFKNEPSLLLLLWSKIEVYKKRRFHSLLYFFPWLKLRSRSKEEEGKEGRTDWFDVRQMNHDRRQQSLQEQKAPSQITLSFASISSPFLSPSFFLLHLPLKTFYALS